MACQDLHDFIALLKKEGELVEISEEIDPYLEISEICDRTVKAGGPALLFKNVKGSSMPVLINQFGSDRRIALALNTPSLDDIALRLTEIFQMQPPSGLVEKVRALGKLKDIATSTPKTVRNAPCQEVVHTGEEVDLDRLPILTCWPLDAGPFITLPIVFSHDTRNGKRNAGMYRLQKYDRRTTGMHWHIHKGGAAHYREAPPGRLEIGVAIGTDPFTTYSATAPLPPNIDEMMFAGFLKGSPVEMVRCKTVDVQVPARAEIILEGYVEIGELRTEGPFGDHTGYYSLAEEFPVFHITAITHRHNPVYATIIVGKPPMEDDWLGKATERLFLPPIKMTVPEIVDMDLPWDGVFHNCVLISIKKAYPGHARKVMYAVWGLGMLSLSKFVVILDEEVDVHNYHEVAWRVFNNVDPQRDCVIVEGPLDVLDHACPIPKYGAKMGIDATTKWKSEGYEREWPPDIVMSPEITQRVNEKWARLGLGK